MIKVLETLLGMALSMANDSYTTPAVGDRRPEKYQALFSDGALTAAP